MKKLPWAKTIRRESGLIEHIDHHGQGHPAFGSIHWMELHGHKGFRVHGCSGACRSPAWQLADAQEGCKVANKLLKDALKTARLRGYVIMLARDALPTNHPVQKILKKAMKK